MEETANNTNLGPMPQNSEIRHNAHAVLKGHWLYPVLATLLYLAVTSAVSCIPRAGLLVVLPLGFGFNIAFLKLSRGLFDHEDVVTAPFGVFRDYGRYLGGSLLVTIFTYLWTLLLIVPGIIKGLSYTMTPFILLDNPELPVREAIRKSQQMMNGYKWKLFCLYLSFIGWGILACLTFGIGFLWLVPYIQTSVVKFYEELKSRA